MSPSIFKRRGGGEDGDGSSIDAYHMLPRLQVLAAIGCLLIYFYSLQFLGSGSVLRVTGVGILIGGAALVTGCLLGFIFGIPRTGSSGSSAKEQENAAEQSVKPEGAPAPSPVRSNTNLNEISDWLTKIMVGVGLVELSSLPGKMERLAEFLGPGLRPPDCDCTASTESSQAAAIAIAVYYFAVGFLFGYVWTRLYFEGDIARLAKRAQQLEKKDFGRTWLLRADALMNNEDKLEEALGAINRALEENPSDPLALVNKARILKRLAQRGRPFDRGLLNEAATYAMMAANLAPGKAEPLYNLACYQALLGGDPAEALRNLKKALQLNPSLREIARNDTDLEGLRELPEFRALVSPPETQGD